MKKRIGIILAIALALSMVCVASYAEEAPQPEGGRKFDSNWALCGATVQVVYEGEGYRVLIRSFDPAKMKGVDWEYSCFFHPDRDALVSVSSLKRAFTRDPNTGDDTYEAAEYEGLDDENTATVFTVSENGFLRWADGRRQEGAGLEFTGIGRFAGLWRGKDGKTWAEIEWSDSREFYGYFVYVFSGDLNCYTEHAMHGLYNPETGKLETAGAAAIVRRDAEGAYDREVFDEAAKLVFSDLGGGKILLEAGNGIELVYDIDV